MDVLKAIAVAACAIFVIIIYRAIESICVERHGAKPVSRWTFLGSGVAGWLVLGGQHWRQELIATDGDVLNGTATIGLGVALAVFIVGRHLVRLRLCFGLLATALNVALVPLAMLLAPLYPLYRLFAAMGVTPVRVVDQ